MLAAWWDRWWGDVRARPVAVAAVRHRLSALTGAPSDEPAPVGWTPGLPPARRWERPGTRLVLGVLAVAVLGAGWMWWGSRDTVGPTPAPVVVAAGTPMAPGPSGVSPPGASAVTPGASAGPPGASASAGVSASGTGGPAAVVVVHVLGPVRRPGVLRLPAGSRVVDAVAAAGGLLAGADPGPVNLARVLVDGEQVRLGPGAPVDGGATAPGGSPTAATGLVDLNAAGLAELDALPGVGPVLAQRILALRAERGRFTSVEELREVAGIGEKTFADIKGRVRV